MVSSPAARPHHSFHRSFPCSDFFFFFIFSDEQQEETDNVEPSSSELCYGDAPACSQISSCSAADLVPNLNNSTPSVDNADSETSTGSQDQADQPAAAPAAAAAASCPEDVDQCAGSSRSDSEPPTETTAQPDETTDNDNKQEEAARSPSPLTVEQPAKRRACHKKRRNLFTIQAVNSNGTTERGMGEGGSAVSFCCESKCGQT